MTDASVQLLLPFGVEKTSTSEVQSNRALAREQGGTGASVSSMADLLTHLQRNAVNGLAPLDGTSKVPAANLSEFTGASSGSPGTAGTVPAPAAGDQYRPLRGNKTFDTTLELTAVVDDAGTPLVDFESLGDLGCRIALAAADSAGQKARIVATGSGLSDMDLSLEAKGAGRLVAVSDPIPQTMKPSRKLQAVPNMDGFLNSGLPVPQINSPGSAPVTYADTNGSWVRLVSEGASQLPAYVRIPSCTQRRWDPEVVFVFEASFTAMRVWLGFFSSSPTGVDTLGAIKGVGVHFNQSIDANSYHFILSDGASEVNVDTNVGPAGNAYQAIRIRSLGSNNWDVGFGSVVDGAWTWFTYQTNGAGLALSDNLDLWILMESTAADSNKNLAIKVIDLFEE